MLDPLKIPNVWRAQSLRPHASIEPTGFDALDVALGGGWPTPALLEIITDVFGIGELQLILPLLRALAKRVPAPPLITWLNPPHQPNAVALAQHGLGDCQHWLAMNLSSRDTLWSMERALKAGACSAVLAWATNADTASLRRMRLAVSTARIYGILYRPSSAASHASPAHVRLQLSSRGASLHVKVLKAEGRKPSDVVLDIDSQRLHPEVRT
jgi:cell division inhibitor SulA